MYFWGKHVHGFDNTKHCARCLIGPYEKSISKNMPLNADIEISFNGKAFYLCGVAKPYRWEHNFHLALISGTDTLIEKTYNDFTVIVEGVRKFEFSDEKAAISYSYYGNEFKTCRNFQFGVSFFEN
jgi:hypothetical protein